MSRRSTAALNPEPKRRLRGEEDPQLASTLNHTGIHPSQFDAQSEHSHHQQSKSQQLESYGVITDITFFKPNIIEDGDPLNSPSRLQSGAILIDVEHDLPNTMKKSPSNQELSKSKWGTPGRTISGRSKTGLQIRVPDRQTNRPVPTGAALYDKSIVYVYSSSSSGDGRTSHSFGAIGDRRSPRPEPLSAPSASNTPERPRVRLPATAGHYRPSPVHNLVDYSNPRYEDHGLPMADENIGPSTALLTYNALGNSQIQVPATAGHLQYPTLHDLVDDSTPDSDQYVLLVAGETGPLRRSIVPYRIKPSELEVRTRRRRSMTDLKETPITSPKHTEGPSTKSMSHQGSAPSLNAPASNSSFPVDGTSKESKSIIAPMWRRSGPSFASSIRPMARLSQGAQVGSHLPQPAIEDATSHEQVAFQDKLDPEEFSLPYGSIVYSMKSNNITNLQISITKSVWTSTLGSNIVLTEAWDRKNPGEKIILLFSITHSTKHSGKYLGMAEMVGPLDLEADCEFWTEKKNGTRGLIPVRWVVTKDVPFSKFRDLKYHEQNITQVRHGNTIPGEVGRLVIQRYFETAHGSTAVLHPLSQSSHDVGAPRTGRAQSPIMRRNERWTSLPCRREVSRGGLTTFQHGRRGFRSAFRGRLQVGPPARWSQNGSANMSNTLSGTTNLNPKGIPHPTPGSFHSTKYRDIPPSHGQTLMRGGLRPSIEEPSIARRGSLQGRIPPNGYDYLFQSGDGLLEQLMGPYQQTERDSGEWFARERNSRLR